MTRFIRRQLKLLGGMSLLLPVCALALSAIGVAFVYSACSVRDDPDLRVLHLLHATSALAGMGVAFLMAFLNYRRFFAWSWVFYALCLVALVLVLLMGERIMGARRWLFGVQPSEPAKLAIIMVLAWLYSRRDAQRGVAAFLLTWLVTGVPMLLILLQPDLGSAMVLLPTVMAMLFAAKVSPRLFWSLTTVGALCLTLLLGAIYKAEDPGLPPEKREALLSATMLRPHQTKRLQVFMFPDKDIYGSGYNRRQSEIAVGSGGLKGRGYRQGVQYTLGYLPPSVSANDFIFAVLAEEAGFVGSVTVLGLFLGMLWSIFWIGVRCKDDMGRLFCVGAMTLIFSHMFINIAMTIGLMPITGLPLPFISYGRTFMLTMMLAIGIAQSISAHGREVENKF